MMLGWADQEEQERDRFPCRNDNNQKRNGDSRSNKNQRNFDKKTKAGRHSSNIGSGSTMQKGESAR
jgi:hypothetical protein